MSKPVIAIRGLSKIYSRGTEAQVIALKNVDLQIMPGEFVAIMGASGSGKSTLMNVLGCLDADYDGEYRCDGIDVRTLDKEQLAKLRLDKIGFVFQTFNLLPRQTALQNVALPLVYAGWPKADRLARATEVLGMVGLGDRMDHQPNQLSGGQRQRVAIARALVNTPSMVLADEPTGNLDSATSVEIMRLFDEIHARGNTLVVVTHEEDIARHAKRIVRLRDGLIESDEPNR